MTPLLADKLRDLARTELFRLVTGAGALFACRISGAAIGYITLILLARWMGANELGTYVFAYSWCITLTMMATLGYPGTSFRIIGLGLTAGDFGLIRGFVRRGRQIAITAGTLIAGGGAVLILLTGELVLHGDHKPFLIALACVPIFALARLNMVVSHAFSWFALAMVPDALVRPLLLFIAVTLLWLAGLHLSASAVLWLFMGSLAVVTITQHTMLSAAMHKVLGAAQPTYNTRSWIRAGLPLLSIVAFTAYFPEVSITIAGAYLPADDIAKLNVGIRTAFMIAIGLTAVDQIISPRISRLFAEDNIREFQRVVTGATHLKFWSALAAFGVFAVFGHEILGLFGEEFRDSYSVLMIFSMAMIVRAGVGPVTLILIVTGHQNRCILVYSFALVLHLLLNLILIPRFGINGAAFAMLATTVFWSVWLHAVVLRHIGVHAWVLAIPGNRRRDTEGPSD